MSPTTYNKIAIPTMMYGTAWKKDATTKLVQMALDAGFRAIDTANQIVHYDEARVGEALKPLYKTDSMRDKLFLQTKFTSVDGQRGRTPYDAAATPAVQVKQSMDSSLSHLHTDYVDSYVLHGPYSRGALTAADWEVWSAMEELFRAGKTKMIGVSNITAPQLAELCSKGSTKPMVVQNRCYASMSWDKDVRDICRAHDIIYQGFSLLTANGQILGDPSVQAIAKRLSASVTKVIFAFAIKIGMLPLTGTSNLAHMKDDLEAHQLSLSDAEVQAIENSAFD